MNDFVTEVLTTRNNEIYVRDLNDHGTWYPLVTTDVPTVAYDRPITGTVNTTTWVSFNDEPITITAQPIDFDAEILNKFVTGTINIYPEPVENKEPIVSDELLDAIEEYSKGANADEQKKEV